MPGRVAPPDRVAQGIQVGVDPGFFRCQRVGAVEAHQHGVVGAVAAAEQVPAKGLLAHLAIERQQAAHAIGVRAFAIGAVAGMPGACLVSFGDDAAGVVGQQQQRVGRRIRALHRQGMRASQQVLGQQVAFLGGVQAMVLVTPLHHAAATVHTGQQLVMAIVQVLGPFAAVAFQYALQAPLQVVLQGAPLLVVEHVAARVVAEALRGRVVRVGVGHLGQLEAVVRCIAEARHVLVAIGKPRHAALEVVQGIEGEVL
ncbi:hypothetical protein D3C76_994400 [compost metagenome]